MLATKSSNKKSTSLKLKFTLLITGTLVVMAVVISGVFYSSVLYRNRPPLTTDQVQRFAQNNPELGRYLKEDENLRQAKRIGDRIRENEIDRASTLLKILIPLAVLLSALIGYLASSYLVKPIENLAQKVSKINSRKLSKRLPVEKSSEEIEVLVTKFNKLLNELEEAFLLQERFIQDAAHELRTPLAATKATIEVFQEEKGREKADYERAIQTLEKLNSKMISLNEKLLFLNRRESSEKTFEKVDIKSLLEEVVDTMKSKAQSKKVKILLKTGGDTAHVKGDFENLSIAVQNLVSNAIKYSRESSKIKVKLETDDGFAKVTVTDFGIGIPKRDLKKVSERFFRSENARTLGAKGEGLGLSIVKKIIEDHNGELHIKSGVQKGTTVVLILPLY